MLKYKRLLAWAKLQLSDLRPVTMAASDHEDEGVFEKWSQKYKTQYCFKDDEDMPWWTFWNVTGKSMNTTKGTGQSRILRNVTTSHFNLSDMEKHRHGYEEDDEDDQVLERSTRHTKTQFSKGSQSIDRRKKSVTRPASNQGHCGSCWTFSTAAVVDVVYRKKGRSGFLSKQWSIASLVNMLNFADSKIAELSR